MHRRCFSTSRRLSAKANPDIRARKKMHWQEEARLMNNINRALTHYDDFYSNIFGKQWPSLRLGLLSPPKYMAIPNTFTGNVEAICGKLEGMGAYNIHQLWTENQAQIEMERRDIDMKKDLGRLHQLDKRLEAIAAMKKAEEMDVLYQNAPTSKREEMRLGKASLGRVISDVSEAAADFVPSSKLKGMEDFTFDSEYFASYLEKQEEDEERSESGAEDLQEISFLKTPLVPLELPKVLLPHSFENGSALLFPAADRDSSSNLREYICVNGASILPVIALDLKPGNNMLDMCAGPGTKSILSLMTMTLDSLVCNDLEGSRLARVKRICQEFTGSSTPSAVTYTKFNSKDHPARQEFARVLADVPCLNDRVSCTVSDNNIFKPRRTKERLSLVKTQREILLAGFKTLDRNEGSAIVYSTCTLSPIENDGVVMNAMKETEIMDLHIDLIGLMKLIGPFERFGLFKIMRTRCGVLVLPNAASNFGPMYVSRIVVSPATTNRNLTSTDNVPTKNGENEALQ